MNIKESANVKRSFYSSLCCSHVIKVDLYNNTYKICISIADSTISVLKLVAPIDHSVNKILYSFDNAGCEWKYTSLIETLIVINNTFDNIKDILEKNDIVEYNKY